MSEYVGRSSSELEGDIRIVINQEGEAIPGALAVEQAMHAIGQGNLDMADDISPHVIFVRGDGWRLGASPKFEEVAYNMWKDEWVGFVKCPNDVISDISDYTPGEQEY